MNDLRTEIEKLSEHNVYHTGYPLVNEVKDAIITLVKQREREAATQITNTFVRTCAWKNDEDRATCNCCCFRAQAARKIAENFGPDEKV
jgi:hypothetical protein